MAEEEWDRIKRNLFNLAHEAVQPWQTFRWHRNQKGVCQTFKPNSSQALAIDLFGFLRVAEQAIRDAVIGGIAELLKLPAGGPWKVELEWIDQQNRLREAERYPTHVDCVARSPESLIFFECKFTEDSLGECSQTSPLKSGPCKGRLQCNGNYERQINPLYNSEAKCALSAKAIRYWDVIPKVFSLDAHTEMKPCPFAGNLYQMMRNAVLCHEVASAEKLQPGFAVIYAAGDASPPAQQIPQLVSRDFRPLLRADKMALAVRTYQEILKLGLNRLCQANCPTDQWAHLSKWIDDKIQNV